MPEKKTIGYQKMDEESLPNIVRYEGGQFEAQLGDLRERFLRVIKEMRPERLRDIFAHHREFWHNMHKCVEWANSDGGRRPLRIEELNAEVATLVQQWHSLNRVRLVSCCCVFRRRPGALACCSPSTTHPALSAAPAANGPRYVWFACGDAPRALGRTERAARCERVVAHPQQRA